MLRSALPLAFLLALPVRAQVRDAGAGEGDLLDEHADDTPHEEDPISPGRPDELDLPATLPDGGVPTVAPPSPPIAPVVGPVLTAIPGVREVEHAVRVHFALGTVTVDETIRFVSSARVPAELIERLAMPAGATLTGFGVDDGRDVRVADVGAPADPDDVSAAGQLRRTYDAEVRARPRRVDPRRPRQPVGIAELEGNTLVVRAAAIAAGGTLRLSFSWAAPAPFSGGVARFTLPARAQDPRAAPLSVVADVVEGTTGTLGGRPVGAGSATFDPWRPVPMTQSLPSGGADVRADARRATERITARVVAPPRPLTPRDLIVLVDASPSTEGPPRGRIVPALLALFAVAPSGSRVRIVAFAARTADVLVAPVPVERVPTAALVASVDLDLGHATRLDTAVARIAPWLRNPEPAAPRPLVVVVGDGGIADDATTRDAIATLRRLRVEAAVIDVSDTPPSSALAALPAETGGAMVVAGAEADAAARGRDDAPLVSAVTGLLAPVVVSDVVLRAGTRRESFGPLRAGEEVDISATSCAHAVVQAGRMTWDLGRRPEGCDERTRSTPPGSVVATVWPADAVLARAAPATCDRLGPAFRAGGQSTDAAPVALAEPRCAPAPTTMHEPPARPLDGRGVPAETVRRMVHDRLLPAARACFRADRHGRARYSARAVLSFALRDREILAQEVGGELAAPLRACLADALDRVDVPRFEGTVVVHYPLRTEAEPEPEIVELAPGVALDLDRVIGDRVGETDVRAIVH